MCPDNGRAATQPRTDDLNHQRHVQHALTRLRDRLNSDGGFTLLETLAVMVIVGLLAAITVPQIATWRQKAVQTAVISDVKRAGLAILMECEEDPSDVCAKDLKATVKPGATSVLGQPLGKDAYVAYYGVNEVGGTWQLIVRSTADGPWANYSNLYGQCRKGLSGPYKSC
jgi:prepilin-type N-terminal cleavage/methylation domain-containing protein